MLNVGLSRLFFKKPEESLRLVTTALICVLIGVLIGFALPNELSIFGTTIIRNFPNPAKANCPVVAAQDLPVNKCSSWIINQNSSTSNQNMTDPLKIWALSNPPGAERLPPDIVESESDFYMRRLWGIPSEDLKIKPRYLVTFTVGYEQKNNIDAAVKKFSDDFQILLFHYDGRTTEWDEYEWSRSAIHISARKQTKWWFAKRFLHPDIVAAYEYIFIWDEDLGLEHFDGEEYLKLVKKYGLEISQPGVEPLPGSWLTWKHTIRRNDTEVHKTSEGTIWQWQCQGLHMPPCAAFVEIMAPVFSKEAWRCVWHMIQNDLVHGWGLDFALRQCVEPAHEKIGMVDAQWIIHQRIPSLTNQGQQVETNETGEAVTERCHSEWQTFQKRLEDAKNAYYKSKELDDPAKATPQN